MLSISPTGRPTAIPGEALLVDTVASSLRGLAVRGELARALLDAGQLDEAGQGISGLIDDYRRNFGPGHPKAAELELGLARIDQIEGRPQASAERVARVAPLLQQSLAPSSPALALLDCLSQPEGHRCD